MPILLNLLSDGKPHSYQKLTALLGCKETELQAAILQWQQNGICFEQQDNEIRLVPQTPLLSAVQLQQVLQPYRVIYQPVIDSTNRYLLEHIHQLKQGDLCVTEYQTAGRGRRGRQWQSPFGAVAMMSFVWQTNSKKPLDGFSLVVGMAIYQALTQLGAKAIQLKWPNDILLQGRKLAGILIEIAPSQTAGMLNLVVGIGINVALPQANNPIDQPWANLTETLPEVDRTLLIQTLIPKIYQALSQFNQQSITPAFQQQWQQADIFFGQSVNLINDTNILSGIEQGIDLQGNLLVKLDNGEITPFNAGDVSLRRK